MRGSVLLLMFAITGAPCHGQTATAPAATQTARESWVHKQTGIELPLTVGGFKRGEPAPYAGEIGKDSIQIPYTSADAGVTVFLHELAADSKETAADELDNSLAAVQQLAKDGMYTDLKIYKSDGKNERPGWQRAAFTAKIEDKPVASFIYCAVKNGYRIKLRATSQKPNEELQKFLAGLQERVDAAKKP